MSSPAGRKIWNFEFQQILAWESYQKSQLDCWLSTNSKNLRVFASIKTLGAKLVFMKISCRPLPIYGCFVYKNHEKINRNIFLPKCPEIDDTLVLKPKKTCWLAFDWKITIWLCGVKIKLSVLQGENYETWISTKSCSVKLSKVSIGLLVVRKFKKPERGEKITKIWTSANLALVSGMLSEVLIGLLVPKKLEKTERNSPNKNIGDCEFP